jgi:hypothetical protein
MNKRIIELADQSWNTFDLKGVEIGPPYAFAERFAELIVRKCINICRDVDGVDDHSMRVSRQDCACEIRDYFGVEE